MKTFLHLIIISLLSALVMMPAEAYENDCCNDAQPAPGCSPIGTNPIHAGMANLHRQVTDLETYGAASIPFTRIFNSRTTNFNDSYWDFGARQTWQHNWNYEVRQLTTKSFNQFDIKVRYPDGTEYNFKAPDATSNQRIPPADSGDRLYKWTGSVVGYTLITADGKEFDFWRYLSPKFHLTEMRDGQGLKWTLTYNSDTTLKRIANPFGRWLELERTSVNGVLCITRVYSSDGRQVIYSYSPWPQTGSVVLTTVNYPAGDQAHYTWVTSDPTTPTARPLLDSATDPLYPGAGGRMRYVYNYDARFNYGAGPYLVTGMVKEERNFDQNTEIVSLPLGGGHNPQILDGNNSEITRKFLYGLVTETRDAENRATFYTYTVGGFGYLATATEPNGAVTSYDRDYAGRVVSRTDILGHTRSFTYNPAGFEVSRTDERSNTTTTTRDTVNRPMRIDYPDGTYESWSYNSYGQPLTHRSRNGGAESFAYYNGTETGGKLGDLKTSTDPLGNVTTFTYASSGLRSTIKDGRNNTTSFAYNWRGQLETVTHPDASVTRNEYDTFGNRSRQVDELGHAWTYSYDEFNHVASRTDPLGRITSFEYGGQAGCPTCAFAETLTRVTSPSGMKTEYEYDRSGKPTAQIVGAGTPEAAATTYAYTADGDVDTITDPRGKITRFAYDPLHRRTSMTDPIGHTTTYTYDAAGNKLTETRPNNATTSMAYDSMNRLRQSTDPKSQVTTLSYDGGNNLISLTDARNNLYAFTYDLLNRKTKMVFPDQSFEQSTFDSASNLATFQNRAGQVETCTYDSRDRMIFSDWSDTTPDITRTYDVAGRLLTLTSNVSTLSYGYDEANQLLSETQQIMSDGGPKSVTYTYDADGARATVGYPSGSVASYSYNLRGQMAGISSDEITAGYNSDLSGNRVSKSLANGVMMTYEYDDANRPVSLNIQKSGINVLKFDYTYNSVNGRTSRSVLAGRAPATPTIENYVYDAIDQITNVEYKSGDPVTTDRAVSYAYDLVGNRTSVTDNGTATPYLPNELNQYTAVDGDSPAYDAKGNLKTQHNWTYTYDARSRLTSAISAQSSVISSYDGRNRCVSRTVNGITTFYYYDGWRLLEEQDAAGTLLARYVNGAEIDEIIARVSPFAASYYHHDTLGSTVALTDGDGGVVESYSYDIFGAPTIKDGTGAVLGSSAFGNRFLFAGREFVPLTLLYDYRNRVYSPELGRFLQTDPSKFGGGDSNLYSYVSNNPVGLMDPFGLLAWDVATYYTYPQWILHGNGVERGGQTSKRKPEVTAECKCDACSQWVLDQLRVKLTLDVAYAQGYGSQYKAFVQATEPDHEREIRAWADNEGRNKAQTQEDQLKKHKFPSQEQCQSVTSQAALSRIQTGLNKAWEDSRDKHDYPGGDHDYTGKGPLYD